PMVKLYKVAPLRILALISFPKRTISEPTNDSASLLSVLIINNLSGQQFNIFHLTLQKTYFPAKTCIRRVAKLVCTKRFSKYRFYCRIQTSGLTFVRNSHMSIADFLQQKKREKAEANLKEALDFLAENGKKPSVQVTSSGLQYE